VERVVLITGGMSGIGLATAQAFARGGDRVSVADTTESPAGREVVRQSRGRYFAAESETALQDIYRNIDVLEKSRVGRTQYAAYNELAVYFLFAALLLLALELGLKATIRGRNLQSLALELIELSRAGLGARQRLNSAGDNETGFLAPLQITAESGKTPAELKLERFHTAWAGSVDPVFSEYAY